jgi:fucose permease
MPSATLRSQSLSLPLVPIFAGFALCGLATVLLGPLLPFMDDRWNISDAKTGLLFGAQFVSSTITAVLSPWRVRHSIIAGYLLLTAGLATLAFANYTAAIAAFSFIGLGIGLSVTATNMLTGSVSSECRARLLTQSNFFWGAGAVVCAPLVGLAERQHFMRTFLLLSAAAAAATAFALTPMLHRQLPDHQEQSNSGIIPSLQPGASPHIGIFLLFATVLFFYVGAESSIGGWITVYAHRFLTMSSPSASFMALLFWTSILFSRAISSILLKHIPEASLLLPSILIAIAGTLFLLARLNSGSVIASVLLAGLGCGPIFPLLMSSLFTRTENSLHNGWVFAISGGGGAVLPWLTGLLSTQTGSLRIAFIVPVIALAGIFFFVLFERRNLLVHS